MPFDFEYTNDVHDVYAALVQPETRRKYPESTGTVNQLYQWCHLFDYRTNQFQQNIFKHFKLVVTSLYHQFLKDTQDIDIELFNKT